MSNTGLSLFEEGYRLGGLTRYERFRTGMAAACRDPADNAKLIRLSGVLWIGSALTRNGAVNYVDSVAMLGIHKLKVLEMAKAAEADRVGATYGQMRAAEVSLGRLLGMVFTPIWNEVYALGVRRGWTGGAHVLRGAIQLLCSEIALPGMFSGGLGVDDLEG